MNKSFKSLDLNQTTLGVIVFRCEVISHLYLMPQIIRTVIGVCRVIRILLQSQV